MKTTGFKNKYSPLKRSIGLKRSPFVIKHNPSGKNWAYSSFKKNKPKSPRKILDEIVSKCIRLGSSDKQGMVVCVTCGHSFHWTEIQCGHFQKRGHTSTRYDMKNLGPQCEDCNCFKDGENEIFAAFIDRVYGPGTADDLRAKAKEIERYYPYEEEIIKWKEVYKKLVEEKVNEIKY